MDKLRDEYGAGGTDPLDDSASGHLLTRAIIDTIQTPLLVLDEKLAIIVGSKAFYEKFKLDHDKTSEVLFYNLNDGEWDVPQLRELLEKIIPEQTVVQDFQIEHDFKSLGQRTLLISAREIRYENGRKKILLAFRDVTEQRQLERDKERLSEQKDILLREMRHRIANSLQLIASILILKAQTVQSEESRLQLEDAHQRIMSIATVQQQLDPASVNGEVPVAEYLKGLCESLAKSMIGGRKPITIEVNSGKGTVLPDEAISLGLISTELVINSLKHAFPDGRTGRIVVGYESDKLSWKLSVTDDGVGMPEPGPDVHKGLGTNIIASLAKQLNATISTVSSDKGAAITISHKTA